MEEREGVESIVREIKRKIEDDMLAKKKYTSKKWCEIEFIWC